MAKRALAWFLHNARLVYSLKQCLESGGTLNLFMNGSVRKYLSWRKRRQIRSRHPNGTYYLVKMSSSNMHAAALVCCMPPSALQRAHEVALGATTAANSSPLRPYTGLR